MAVTKKVKRRENFGKRVQVEGNEWQDFRQGICGV